MPDTATPPVILVDTSASMNFPQSGRQRIDIAADVVRLTLNKVQRARIVLFSSRAIELVGVDPGGPDSEAATSLRIYRTASRP